MKGRGRRAAAGEGARRAFVHRSVRPALEVGLPEPSLAEHRLGDAHVTRLTAVGRARQGDLVVPQAKRLLASGLQERHRLERLGRRTREDGNVGVAAGPEKRPAVVDDGHHPPVRRFDARAPEDARDDRRGLGHARPL